MNKTEDWKIEFREYFDKTLKPKKPTIENLDRELIIDFINKLLIKEREQMVKDLEIAMSEMYTITEPEKDAILAVIK